MASSVETKICFGTVKRAKPFWASSLPAVIVTLIGLSPASLKMSPTARPTPVSSITSSVVKHREMMSVGNAAVLPGSETTVGGYSAADLIVIDEAARVKDSLLQAVRPMLATSQGRLVALTTPAGKRGWFYEAWIGDSPWYRVKVPASMCPRI
ncbi:MAG: hypothetical protein WA770_11755 [Pseudolabrys sp.]|jgi:hypothetical protein